MLGEKIGSLTANATNTPLPGNGALPRDLRQELKEVEL